jgi:hypothetical protein
VTTDKEIRWIDAGREPKEAPNPDYPHGIDLDFAGSKRACLVALPYPARRVGIYFVECRTCGWSGGVTTAGRPDDPRSVKIPCTGTLQ